MVFADADFQADIAREALENFKLTLPAFRYQATAEELADDFNGKELSPEAVIEKIHAEMKRDFFRNSLAGVLEKAATGHELTERDVSTITSAALEYTTPAERARTLETLLSGTIDSYDVEAIAKVLTADHYGSALSQDGACEFFGSLTLTSLQHLLKMAPSERQAEILAHSWIESELDRFISGLPAGPHREELLFSRNKREKLRVLAHLSPEERISFSERILFLATGDSLASRFISDKLDNALQFFSLEEKIELAQHVLAMGLPSEIDEVLRSNNSLEDLTQMVTALGVNKLLSLQNKEVDELVASAVLLSQLREIDFSTPGGIDSEEQAFSSLQGWLNRMEEVRAIIGAHPELSHTTTSSEFLETVQSNLLELSYELSEVGDNLELIEDLVLRYWKMAELEFYYGIDISCRNSFAADSLADAQGCHLEEFGIPDTEDHSPVESGSALKSVKWEMHHLEDIIRVLERIPEAEMLFTPMLHKLELVESLGRGVLGARYRANGVIQITKLALDHRGMEAAYEGESSLAIVLAHEIGHGIQIGDGPAGIYYPRDGSEPFFGEGEAIHDFDEWMKLSDWRVYERDRFVPSENSGYIILDDQELKIGEPVAFNGQTIVLTYNHLYGVLYSYDANSEFSNRWYAKYNPWEDFAEAFSEYLFLPERLIEDAPEKFKHLELEFRRYADNSEIQNLLKLRERVGPEQ